MELSPLKILNDAQKSLPAMKYAAGVAGIASVVAIVAGFQIDIRIAVFGTIIVLGLMFVLVVFSALAAHAGPNLAILALVGAWSFLLLTIAASFLLFTSYFFSWPRTIDSYLPPPTPTPIVQFVCFGNKETHKVFCNQSNDKWVQNTYPLYKNGTRIELKDFKTTPDQEVVATFKTLSVKKLKPRFNLTLEGKPETIDGFEITFIQVNGGVSKNDRHVMLAIKKLKK